MKNFIVKVSNPKFQFLQNNYAICTLNPLKAETASVT